MRYSWSVEVRETRNKTVVRKVARDHVGNSGFVPHITLVYPFAIRHGVKPFQIMQEIKIVSKSYRSLDFVYDGLQQKDTADGKKITVFRVNASRNLKEFRYMLYHALKDMILEEPQTHSFNDLPQDRFWFHATVSMRRGLNVIQQMKEFLIPPDKVQSKVERISLQKSQRIVYEYDRSRDRILNRSQALIRGQIS